MFQALLDRIRRHASGEHALESVRALARFHRVQASPGYDAAAGWLTGRLAEYGLEVETDQAPGDGHARLLGQLMPEGWACERAVATLVAGEERERLCDYDVEKLSLILRSAPARGRHPIVALADGSEDDHYRDLDVAGRVVLTSGEVQRVHQLAVLERGAAGLLSDGRRLVHPVRDAFDDPDALAYTSFWWPADATRGWGFVVSPRTGARLRAALAKGVALALEVEIESRAFSTPLPLVSARLPGRTADEILVVSHLCHPQPSANDNASGVAANLETARTLAALLRSGEIPPLERGIRFLWVPELTGTFAWLGRDPRRIPRTVAALNLDMVGEDQEQCGSTFLIEHPPFFAASFAEELIARIRFEAQDWVRSFSGPGHYSMTRMAEVPYSGGSDHAVLIDPAIGVPCPLLIQWPDRYYHSSHDTPDKCDPGSLALAVRCAATYAGFLATAGAAETEWLLAAVARGARTRLLRSADRADPGRERARALIAGASALASLARLGVTAGPIESARIGLEEFAARELPGPEALIPGKQGDGARPRRLLGAPLHYQRHLLPGHAALARARREEWRRLEAATPDGMLLTELAWHACDGKRTLGEIARQVWLETGRHEPAFLGQFFGFAAELGLCRLETGEG